jgi:hypothetical protein
MKWIMMEILLVKSGGTVMLLHVVIALVAPLAGKEKTVTMKVSSME